VEILNLRISVFPTFWHFMARYSELWNKSNHCTASAGYALNRKHFYFWPMYW